MKLFQMILMVFLVVCAISVSFSKKLLNSVKFHFNLHVLLPGYVCNLGLPAVPGPGDYRGGGRGGSYQYPVFCHVEENPRHPD